MVIIEDRKTMGWAWPQHEWAWLENGEAEVWTGNNGTILHNLVVISTTICTIQK